MKGKILELLKDKKKTNVIIVFLVIIGLVLVLSSFVSPKTEEKTTDENHAEYIKSLEEKIAKIASNVTGLEAEATLTLETGTEYVYLDQNTTESQKNEQSYIVINDGEGGEKALIVNIKESFHQTVKVQ